MQALRRFRQQVAWVFARGALLVLAAMLLAPTASAATPSQAGVSWDYRLLGKLNSSRDPAAALTIVITGSGSFDLSQPSITGGGSYTVLNTEGSVVGSGTWVAETFDSFTPVAPGGSPGEAGHLELEALFSGTGAGTLNGLTHVVVQCSMWGPTKGSPGYPWPPDFVTAGSYTLPTTGGVMFNLNQ